jgi:hypothetical protein
LHGHGYLQHCQYFETRGIFPKGAKVGLDPGDTFMKYEELKGRGKKNMNYRLSEEVASYAITLYDTCSDEIKDTFCGIRKHDH